MTKLLLAYLGRNNGNEILIQNCENCVIVLTKKVKKGFQFFFSVRAENKQNVHFHLSVHVTLSVVLITLPLFISRFLQRCPMSWFLFVAHLTTSGMNYGKEEQHAFFKLGS